jgi:hypothetical protein
MTRVLEWFYKSGSGGDECGLGALVSKKLGAILASFHDQLVEGRVEGHGVFSGEAGHAERVFL